MNSPLLVKKSTLVLPQQTVLNLDDSTGAQPLGKLLGAEGLPCVSHLMEGPGGDTTSVIKVLSPAQMVEHDDLTSKNGATWCFKQQK